MPRQDRELYEFEGFVVDPYRRLLTRDGEPVPLPPKALATLVALLDRHGQVVEKEELIQTVWPDTFITEATLTQNVFRLRKALGEEAGEHRFIVTIPGRGYSFVADVRRRAPALSASGEFPRVELPPPTVPVAQPVTPPASPAIGQAAPPMPLPAAPQALPEEVTAAPVAASATVPDQAAAPPPGGLSGLSPGRRRALFGGSVLVLILLATALFFRHPARSPAPAAPSRPGATTAVVPRRSVAVLGFRNLSGRNETAWLSTALAEMFTVELGVGEALHTITGESVTRTKRDLGLGETENLSLETLAKVHGLLGCDIVLLGSYLALGSEGEGKIRVDLRLQDTGSGDTLAVLTGTRTEEQLFELVSELGQDLRRKLGTATATSPGNTAALTRAAFPANPEAARLYAEGLERLRAFDTLAARDLLQRATEAEPGFPLAHAALARAWTTLGYDLNAEQEATRAFELSATLPREDRLLVEALLAESRREWPKAVEIYESLWRFFPDDLEHGLRLAQAQVTAGQPQRALATTATLRQLPPPLSDDPRIDLSDAEAAASISDYAQLESSAARAAQKGRSLGARLLVAMALYHQGRALRNLGRTEEALAKIDEAEEILSGMGDRVGVARAAHDRANLLRDSGDFEESRRQYERSLAIHREAGNQRGIIRALTNLGALETQRGDYARAQELLREVVDVSREIHDSMGEAHGLSTLGSLLYDQGDLAGAQRAFEESLRQFRSVGSVVGEASVRMSLAAIRQDLGRLREAQGEAETALALSRKIKHLRGMASALRHLGQILLDQGRVDDARAAFQEMEGLARQTGHKLLLASARSGLASIRHVQGDLAGARAEQTEVLAAWTVTDERQEAALSHLALARIARDEGKSTEAERETRDAAERFRDLHLRNGEALSHELLALIALDRGDPGGARREIDAALDLTASSQNRRIRLGLAVTAGRVDAALGKTAEARQELTAARAEATTLGFRFPALEAAIALAEIELRRGDAEAGRAALRAIQQDCTRQGFRLLAGRAERLLREPASRPAR